jgi:hypothetical protein
LRVIRNRLKTYPETFRYERSIGLLQMQLSSQVLGEPNWCNLYCYRRRLLIEGSALLCRVRRKLRFLRNRLKTFSETFRYERSIGLLQKRISSQVLIYVLTGAVKRGHPHTPQQVQGYARFAFFLKNTRENWKKQKVLERF